MAKSVLHTSWPHSRWCQVTPSCLALLLASRLATVCLCQPSQLGQPFTMWRCTQAREASWHALLAPVLALSAKVCFLALATFSSLPVQTVSGCITWHVALANQSIRQQATSHHPYSIFCETLAYAYWSAAVLLFLDFITMKM